MKIIDKPLDKPLGKPLDKPLDKPRTVTNSTDLSVHGYVLQKMTTSNL